MNNIRNQNSVNSGIEESSNENKKEFIYSNFHQLNRNSTNPFFIPIQTEKNQHVGLVDTGADETIMHVHNIPDNAELIKNIVKVKSATRNDIKTIGQVRALNVTVGTSKILISVFITVEKPRYTIIGYKEIMKN